jgi:hypothetical protein
MPKNEIPVDLALMHKIVSDAKKRLVAAERADKRAAQELSAARESHASALAAFRSACESVEDTNK